MKKFLQTLPVIGLIGVSSLIVGCAERGETNYQAKVNDELKAAKLDDVRADWKADEKTLHLKGEVERAADKARAEELAKQAVGTSGRVVNEVTVEGTNAEAMDDQIEERLIARSRKTTNGTRTSSI